MSSFIGFLPADGPEQWTAGTLFPRSSKKVARALNALGVTPRDIIAIFQALKEAGALRAQIKII